MRRPTLHDDGRQVTLDLHGARVDEAVRLARDVVDEAHRRGRLTVRIVHGHSTTGRHGYERTIKTALADLVDGGAFGPSVTSFPTEGAVLLGLPPAAAPDPSPIRLPDVL